MKTFATVHREPKPAPRTNRPPAARASLSPPDPQGARIRHLLNRPALQPKLKIAPPDDKYEREADRVADEVMRMPDPPHPRDPLIQRLQTRPTLHRLCKQCEEEQEHLQRKPVARTAEPRLMHTRERETPEVAPEIEARIHALRGRGRPLPPAVRAFMEPRFGADFSNVRIHEDAHAQQLARALNAEAFTLGRDIFLRAETFRQDAPRGSNLLAHELVHTLPQPDRPSNLMWRRRGVPPAATLRKHTGDACACLVHVHNDERNAKAVARRLSANCRYNLVEISPDNGRRDLDVAVALPRHASPISDPNELFPRHIIEACESEIAQGCDPRISSCSPLGDNLACRFYAQLRECSDGFTLPVVALHNNRFGPAGGTGIVRWCNSPAIKKCVRGDLRHPDSLVWTSSENDYRALEAAGGRNVVLQDEAFFGDTDLSTLFNYLPAFHTLPALADESQTLPGPLRYVNIETAHRPRQFQANLFAENIVFVIGVLSDLGVLCCADPSRLLQSRDDPTP